MAAVEKERKERQNMSQECWNTCKLRICLNNERGQWMEKRSETNGIKITMIKNAHKKNGFRLHTHKNTKGGNFVNDA